MVPLYAARVTDLKPGDFVLIECGACCHDGLIHPTALSSLGLGPDERITDLAPRGSDAVSATPGARLSSRSDGVSEGMLGPKPLHIFVVADQFRAASKLAVLIPVLAITIPELHDARTLYLPTASMVCSAFSLELYFKCLIRIGRKAYPRSMHDLSKLFSIIGERNRIKIKRCWLQNSDQVRIDIQNSYAESGRSMPKIDFNFVLSASKDAFTTMRYIYEGVDSDTGWLADTIVECTRQTILEIHPEWEHKRQIFPQPSISFPHPN